MRARGSTEEAYFSFVGQNAEEEWHDHCVDDRGSGSLARPPEVLVSVLAHFCTAFRQRAIQFDFHRLYWSVNVRSSRSMAGSARISV